MDIVIDFDGTVVTHEFPNIGKDIGATPVLRELVENGHRLILFTMRSDIENPISDDPTITAKPGDYLTQAVKWFEEREIPLWGIQANPQQHNWTTSPKAYGQIIIDDAALGCPLTWARKDLKVMGYDRPFVDWIKVRQLLIQRRII